MAKKTIKDLADLHGHRVLTRVDYNVPTKEEDGQIVITDDTRIRETLPTLEYLVNQGAKVVLIAHLGRPKGKREPSMSLQPVAKKLGNLLGTTVSFVDECVGEKATQAVNDLPPGGIVLLENLRYHADEEEDGAEFADQLAQLGDIYVNDAFGAAHRAHASTHGVAKAIADRGGACVAGLLMDRELKFLGDELENPERPYVVILGGAKVSDKINVIDRLLNKADTILIGGAMAYTFRLTLGHQVGKSLVEPDKRDLAKEALEKAKSLGVNFILPQDNIIATPVETGEVDKKGRPKTKLQDPKTNDSLDIPDQEEGVDIGPKTISAFREIIRDAKTIFWNGPMGMFEDDRFAEGTFAVAKAVVEATQNGAKSIIGGGDSVTALNKANLDSQVTFTSTGGGASLEFIEGKPLPGVEVLNEQ